MTAALVTAACSVIAHVILVLIALHTSRLSPMLIHFSSAVFVHFIASAIVFSRVWESSYWHMAAFFWFGVMIYLFIYSAFYKSVSLRLLGVITMKPNGRMLKEQLYQEVIPKGFDGRIDILLSAGLVEGKEGNFNITPAGMRIASNLERVRRVFSIENSGIYFS